MGCIIIRDCVRSSILSMCLWRTKCIYCQQVSKERKMYLMSVCLWTKKDIVSILVENEMYLLSAKVCGQRNVLLSASLWAKKCTYCQYFLLKIKCIYCQQVSRENEIILHSSSVKRKQYIFILIKHKENINYIFYQ